MARREKKIGRKKREREWGSKSRKKENGLFFKKGKKRVE